MLIPGDLAKETIESGAAPLHEYMYTLIVAHPVTAKTGSERIKHRHNWNMENTKACIHVRYLQS